MHIRGQSNMLAELGGAHWGLLPALLMLPWMLTRFTGAWSNPTDWFLLWATLMASYDLASRRIPNPLTAAAALCGLAWALGQGGLSGLGQAALGGLVAFSLMAVFFFFGALGAGDVKALGALGVFLSAWGSLQLFVLTTLCGGAMALAVMLITRRGALAFGGGLGMLRVQGVNATLPYGVAIWAASVLLVITGGVR